MYIFPIYQKIELKRKCTKKNKNSRTLFPAGSMFVYRENRVSMWTNDLLIFSIVFKLRRGVSNLTPFKFVALVKKYLLHKNLFVKLNYRVDIFYFLLYFLLPYNKTLSVFYVFFFRKEWLVFLQLSIFSSTSL